MGIPALITLLALAAAHPGPAAVRFGIADVDSITGCVTLPGQELAAGDSLLVVLFEPEQACRAVITGKAPKPCAHAEFVGDVSYGFRLLGAPDSSEYSVGIAVVAPGARSRFVAEHVELRARRNASPITFRYCTGHEGINFTAWQDGAELWRGYYDLGYDVEPTCTEDEEEEN